MKSRKVSKNNASIPIRTFPDFPRHFQTYLLGLGQHSEYGNAGRHIRMAFVLSRIENFVFHLQAIEIASDSVPDKGARDDRIQEVNIGGETSCARARGTEITNVMNAAMHAVVARLRAAPKNFIVLLFICYTSLKTYIFLAWP